jgi:hypothetical protein
MWRAKSWPAFRRVDPPGDGPCCVESLSSCKIFSRCCGWFFKLSLANPPPCGTRRRRIDRWFVLLLQSPRSAALFVRLLGLPYLWFHDSGIYSLWGVLGLPKVRFALLLLPGELCSYPSGILLRLGLRKSPKPCFLTAAGILSSLWMAGSATILDQILWG